MHKVRILMDFNSQLLRLRAVNLFYCKRYKVAFLNQYTIFGGLHKIACGEKSKIFKRSKENCANR